MARGTIAASPLWTLLLPIILSGLTLTVLIIQGVIFWRQTELLARQTTIIGEQLKQAWRSSQGQLLLELNRDFSFNPKLYRMRKVIESGKPILGQRGGMFTEQDIDDYIGFFEMMSIFVDKEILDLCMVRDNFDVFMEDAYKNREIREYITRVRKIYDGDMYSGFEKLVKRFADGNKKLNCNDTLLRARQ